MAICVTHLRQHLSHSSNLIRLVVFTFVVMLIKYLFLSHVVLHFAHNNFYCFFTLQMDISYLYLHFYLPVFVI
jgi:hypothetical protein